MMRITLVAGARPNFMKIAPLIHAIQHRQISGSPLRYRLVHTGQHYDEKMSETFFRELDIPFPDANLECGGGTQAVQTASIMMRFEEELMQNPTDLVLVVGDVTSTMACAIVAKKLLIQVAHVEGGIRSGDRSMPEEINRLVTDSISDLFFTTTPQAGDNLMKEGIPAANIHFVGNTMIDTLLKHKQRFKKPDWFEQQQLVAGKYLVMTLHRPANVDHPNQLRELLFAIRTNARGFPVVFPVHPRTLKNLKEFGIDLNGFIPVEPMAYLEFNYIVQHALAVITDSGGITEETTVLGIPCMTLRNSTERPETCSIGTNTLLGTDPKAIPPALDTLFSGHWKKGAIPERWDGQTAERIVDILERLITT
ncbi:MAG: UDP-N-acetylglucosamine 2-epimerase (non-hydrolyzing) [Chitinophagaceae bacterium]|nr:UDP-N-acetylglucosamine 2-epimerase (non-hydrolyzing) [Chitinophagaceae bacterium]